jgi:hypothetical protein
MVPTSGAVDAGAGVVVCCASADLARTTVRSAASVTRVTALSCMEHLVLVDRNDAVR